MFSMEFILSLKEKVSCLCLKVMGENFALALFLFIGSLARTFYHTPATAISMGLLEYIRNAVQKVVYHH